MKRKKARESEKEKNKKKKWKSELESNVKVIASKYIKIHPKEAWKTEICIIGPTHNYHPQELFWPEGIPYLK